MKENNKAYIYFNSGNDHINYSGEGPYVLVLNNIQVIASHFCSSRGWAEEDLVLPKYRQEILDQYNVDEVISNGRVVWKRGEE